MHQSIAALEAMFNALLDISRLDAGIVQAERHALPLAPMLARITQEFQPPARAKGLRFDMIATSMWVTSDPALLDRILRNLVGNAIKHTAAGRVLIGCRRRAAHLRIEIWDSGPGIAAADQVCVFQEFYQLRGAAPDRNEGLGLGLAIVERLARLLGHRVILRSTLGRGSMFAIEVPHAAPSDTRLAPTEIMAATTGFAGALVVVIDDDAAVLAATAALLRRWDCTVIAANSLRAVQAQLDQSAPALIIADYRLHDGATGIAVARALREQFQRSIPAVLITGDLARERLDDARNSDMHLLHKPLNPSRLRALLNGLLAAPATGARR